MSSSEKIPGAELAPEPAIKKLFEDSRWWLLMHGKGTGENNIQPEAYSISIRGEVLRSRLPRVASVLSVGTGMELIYLEEDAEAIIGPEVCICIDTNSESSLSGICVFIKNSPDGYRADRTETPASYTANLDLREIEKHSNFLKEFGLDILTAEECSALQLLVDSLDTLAQG